MEINENVLKSAKQGLRAAADFQFSLAPSKIAETQSILERLTHEVLVISESASSLSDEDTKELYNNASSAMDRLVSEGKSGNFSKELTEFFFSMANRLNKASAHLGYYLTNTN